MTKGKHYSQSEPFSQTLETWLKDSRDTTLAGLIKVFAEKSFAIIFVLLMALPALPLPTGGVTHVTELITMLISLELVAGRRSVWLPKRWLKLDVGKPMKGKGGARLIGVIKWLERFSRRRLGGLLANRWALSLTGIVVLLLTIAAFIAPPFSGLDTLPALGVVLVSLALILEDILFVFIGIILGVAGIVLEITAGEALYKGFTHFF